MRTLVRFFLIAVLGLLFANAALAQSAQTPANDQDLAPGSPHVIAPEELLQLLQSSTGEKPLVLNVGPALFYMQARIPGAEYMGAASAPQGMQKLRARVKSLPHDKPIVLYCGCCPWSHCPNVLPAYNELRAKGFSNVKVLYIANNFGSDWVDKGYPTVRGQ